LNAQSLPEKFPSQSDSLPTSIRLGRMKAPSDFARVSFEMGRLHAMREQLIEEAFIAVETHHALLTQMLLQQVGNRDKASRWMCSHQKAFGGRTGYDVIADGETEIIWDVILCLA
jgi:hypothetical protein